MESRGRVAVSFKGMLPMPAGKCPIEVALGQVVARAATWYKDRNLESSDEWVQLVDRVRAMRTALEVIASGPETYPDFQRSDSRGDSIDYGMAVAKFNAAQIAREGLRTLDRERATEAEAPIVKELRDQAARETKTADNLFEARKLRVEWRAADEIERLLKAEQITIATTDTPATINVRNPSARDPGRLVPYHGSGPDNPDGPPRPSSPPLNRKMMG